MSAAAATAGVQDQHTTRHHGRLATSMSDATATLRLLRKSWQPSWSSSSWVQSIKYMQYAHHIAYMCLLPDSHALGHDMTHVHCILTDRGGGRGCGQRVRRCTGKL
jgi:predicted HAD superfamily phosphohydrolase